MHVWYVESQRTDSPTEYNVDVLTLATQQLQSLDAAETPQRLDSPAKNTRRARKRYYEEPDYDEDSEEEFKPI